MESEREERHSATSLIGSFQTSLVAVGVDEEWMISADPKKETRVDPGTGA